MGVSPILISELNAFCELFGIYDLEERHQIYRVISEIDKFYIENLHGSNS